MSIKRSIVVDKTKNKGATQKVGNITIANKTKAKVAKKTTMRPVEPRTFKEDGKTLIIVESPAKSKTIEKFLGSNYKVKASMGHLRDLPSSQLGVDINNDFKARYNNIPGRKKLINELNELADKSSAILLATDPDREGEAISWHLAHILNLKNTDKNRITFNEITEHAVKSALENARSINMEMVDAQQARRVLDRLVGYKLSPLLWKKICKDLSAGRVQSIAVRLICEREREIQAFVPEEYWTIEAEYQGKDANDKLQKFKTELTHIDGEKAKIKNAIEANVILDALDNEQGVISSVSKRKRSRKPTAPFTTSTLQQEGVRKLNFGAKKTMMIAQHLYEGIEVGSHGQIGLITYMRTDSTRISKEIQVAAKEYIIDRYGSEYYPDKPNFYGSKASAQDAHEAIRPTTISLSPQEVAPYLSRDELKLYTLIWNRFIASQMKPQLTESLSMTIVVDKYQLKAQGSRVLFKGFTEVYEETQKEDNKILPLLEKGQIVKNKTVNGIQHFTQPPARFTEAGLIKTLEEKGIGRPSTYAPIMDTIQARNYVEKKDKQFLPTELGFIVVDFLVEYFESIINVNFTAHLEKVLDSIADGKTTYIDVLNDFYDAFEEELKNGADAPSVELPVVESDELCELCNSKMIYKLGRFGKFLACSNFPDCSNTKPIVVSLNIKCPKCKDGDIIERKSRRGRVFYGCSKYPKCDFVVWNKPIDEYCKECGNIMLEKAYKNGTTKKMCSNDECISRPKRKARKKKAEEGLQDTRSANNNEEENS